MIGALLLGLAGSGGLILAVACLLANVMQRRVAAATAQRAIDEGKGLRMTKDQLPEGWHTHTVRLPLLHKDGSESQPPLVAALTVAYPQGATVKVTNSFRDLTHVYRLMVAVEGTRWSAAAACRGETFGDIGRIHEAGDFSVIDIPVEAGRAGV